MTLSNMNIGILFLKTCYLEHIPAMPKTFCYTRRSSFHPREKVSQLHLLGAVLTITIVNSQVKILKKYKHEGEVNRARAMHQDQSVVATASNTGTVYLYKVDSSEQEEEGTYYDKLEHHTENGYGLSWNKKAKGLLLTGSDDSTVALWDITNTKAPKSVFKSSQDIVNDVAWQNEHMFGIASEDKNFYLHDTRIADNSPALTHNIHDSPINSVVFSPKSAHLFATGSSDHTIVLSDLRYVSKRLHTLIGHADAVTSLHWSPHDDRVLASAGGDRRAILWDISKIGEEQSQEDAEDGAPELLFMHGGHTSAITDFAWSPNYEWMMASVSDDNIAQVWQPTLAVVGRATHTVNDDDLE